MMDAFGKVVAMPLILLGYLLAVFSSVVVRLGCWFGGFEEKF